MTRGDRPDREQKVLKAFDTALPPSSSAAAGPDPEGTGASPSTGSAADQVICVLNVTADQAKTAVIARAHRAIGTGR